MSILKRTAEMSAEQIAEEKRLTLQAMGILHQLRLKAIETDKENPGSFKVPDDSYMVLQYLSTCMPEGTAMPYSFEELDEYNTTKQQIVQNYILGPGIGSEGFPKTESEK